MPQSGEAVRNVGQWNENAAPAVLESNASDIDNTQEMSDQQKN